MIEEVVEECWLFKRLSKDFELEKCPKMIDR